MDLPDASKARKLTEEEEKQAKGNCYFVALMFATEFALLHEGEAPVIVHGRFLPPQGVKTTADGENVNNVWFDHAWVEVGDKVFDPAGKKKEPEKPFEKISYYKIFQVDEVGLKTYGVREAWDNYHKTDHLGPWD